VTAQLDLMLFTGQLLAFIPRYTLAIQKRAILCSLVGNRDFGSSVDFALISSAKMQ
jgi:hypothetical protein